MKLAILTLVITAACLAQTTITGPLLDSSGFPANCVLTIRPVSVAGASPTIIYYSIVAGDLAGSAGGYGRLPNLSRHAALQLDPGTYGVTADCTGSGSRSFTWYVPGSTVSIQALFGAVPTTTGTYCLVVSSGPTYSWTTCSGMGTSTISWSSLTSSQWSTLTSSAWSTLTQ